MAGAWSLVFPRYIADPRVGIHFGRARGPFIQSVRLGLYLTAGLAAVWIPLVWQRVWGRAGMLLGLIGSGLMMVGLALTLTRSIWVGLIWGVGVIVAATFARQWRNFVLYSMVVLLLVAIPLKDTLLSFQREYGSQETLESTRMRASFAYVSWLMFLERPVAGFGFGHFPHEKEAYLNDRETELRLNSIRGYIHHNTYLSVLVELGLVGLMPFALLLICWFRQAWRLWNDRTLADGIRGHALLCMVLLGSCMTQMLFHEVSYSVFENGILFVATGLLSGMAADRSFARRTTPSFCTVGTMRPFGPMDRLPAS
jgi:O-antigen ligase